MMRARVLSVAVAVVLATSLPRPVLAQTPAPQGPPPAGGAQAPGPPPGPGGMNQPPKNLMVLPKDFTREQVTAVMRGFTNALGVRCTHCHVGQDGNPQSMDYPSDDKDEKQTAREMLRMVSTINTDFVRKVSGNDSKADVRCETCHRGKTHPPQPLADLLVDTAATDGAEAALAKYTQLRTESLEAGQYDFRARTLIGAGRRLQDEKRPEAAVTLLRGAVALFPDSADVAASLGMTLLQGGDRDGAKVQFDRALQLDPKNGMAEQGLRRLQGGPGGRP